jgi:hypothetical protein
MTYTRCSLQGAARGTRAQLHLICRIRLDSWMTLINTPETPTLELKFGDPPSN